MIDQRNLELIHLVVDGEATPAERIELNDAINRSSEVKAFHDEIEELVERLDAAGAADPPPGLVEGVLARLEVSRGSARPFTRHGTDWGTRTAGSGREARRRNWTTFAWAAAAAIAFLVVLVPLLDSRLPIEPADAAGTIAPVEVSSWPQAAQFQSETTEAGMVLRRRADRIAVFPRLGTEVKGPVTIRWDADRLELVEILSEVRNDGAHRDKGEVIFIAGEVSPVFVLRPRAGAQGRSTIALFIGNQEAVRGEVALE